MLRHSHLESNFKDGTLINPSEYLVVLSGVDLVLLMKVSSQHGTPPVHQGVYSPEFTGVWLHLQGRWDHSNRLFSCRGKSLQGSVVFNDPVLVALATPAQTLHAVNHPTGKSEPSFSELGHFGDPASRQPGVVPTRTLPDQP